MRRRNGNTHLTRAESTTARFMQTTMWRLTCSMTVAFVMLGAVSCTQSTQELNLERSAHLTQTPTLLFAPEWDGGWGWLPVDCSAENLNGVIAWVRDLKDRLTCTQSTPAGEDLQFPENWYVPPTAKELLADEDGTYHGASMREVIEAQLQSKPAVILIPDYLLVLYQLTWLDQGPSPEQLLVTTPQSFWMAVEAAAASGEFVFQSDVESIPQPIVSIGQYTVILPTMTPIHGQDTWGAVHVSDQYGDHTAWDAETIVEMLTKFFAVTKALSFASLEEYAWRLDKVIIRDVLRQYYAKDPSTRFPPIPSIPLTLPVEHNNLMHKCYEARYLPHVEPPSADEALNTAQVLLQAVEQLERDPVVQAIQRTDNRTSSGKKKYFLKRNYSGCSKDVFSFTLSSSSSSLTSMSSILEQNGGGHSHSSSGCTNCRRAGLNTSTSASSSDEYTGTSQTCAARMLVQEPLDLRPTAMSETADAYNEWQGQDAAVPAHGGAVSRGQVMAEVLSDAQELLTAADRMIRTSCGEAWLLQPYIPDMSTGEYRVYLIGGAQAQGLANDTVIVYTPLDLIDGVPWAARHTLPHGFFSSANAGSSELPDMYETPRLQFPVWRDEKMHQMLAMAAVSAAQALVQSGRPIRTGQNVMLRADIIVTHQQDQKKVFINEAHVIGDAGLAFNPWTPSSSLQSEGASDIVTSMGDKASWGYHLAQCIWKEVLSLY